MSPSWSWCLFFGSCGLWKEFPLPPELSKQQLAVTVISKNSKVHFSNIHTKYVALPRLQRWCPSSLRCLLCHLHISSMPLLARLANGLPIANPRWAILQGTSTIFRTDLILWSLHTHVELIPSQGQRQVTNWQDWLEVTYCWCGHLHYLCVRTGTLRAPSKQQQQIPFQIQRES